MQPGRSGVDGELAHRDLDPLHPPVTDPQDLLGIADHHQVDLVPVELKCLERAAYILRSVDGQEDPARAPVLVAVLLDRLTHGRVVDDRQQLGKVILQQPVVQHLIAVVHLLKVDELRQIGRLLLQLFVGTNRLLVKGEHGVGQPTHQAEVLNAPRP